MKKLILLSLCITVLVSCSQKRPAIIERPVFEVWNSSMIEIDKIEISDSATILHLDAYIMPGGWIALNWDTYIRESGSDEKLMVSGSEGIAIGEQITIKEAGPLSFKMIFPPLRPEVTKIDFIEDCSSGCWKILGIHLLPNAKIAMSPVPKEVAITTTEPLPPLMVSLQPVQVSGRMFGYEKDLGTSNVIISVPNIVTGEYKQFELPISDDGSFSGEIIPGIAGIYNSSIGNLFLVPGQDFNIYVDLKKRNRFESRYRTDKAPGDSIYTYISGFFSGADLTAINQSTREMLDYQKLTIETVNMKPEEFKQHILGIMNKHLETQKQKNYPANVQLMVENTIKLTTFSFLMQYESFINYAYMQVNEIKPEDRSKVTFKAEKPDNDYYLFFKGQLNDNMAYLPGFRSLITNLINLCKLPDGNDKPAKERFAYFQEKMAPVLGTDRGILFDWVQVKFYGTQLNNMIFFTDADKQEIREVFRDNPVYAEALIFENDKMEALLAASKENKESVLNEIPRAPQEKMFDAIIAKYRGKVVLVDFWATWCGPCMSAMQAILPMKAEMKGKDVVFLYLTGETSPLGDFTKTYPTITGEHYRVSEAQWRYWMNTFDIPGIPTYMIYDRHGKQLARHLGFPGVDEIRKGVEKGL